MRISEKKERHFIQIFLFFLLAVLLHIRDPFYFLIHSNILYREKKNDKIWQHTFCHFNGIFLLLNIMKNKIKIKIYTAINIGA